MPVESLMLSPSQAAGLSSNGVAILWPGHPNPLRLDPLLVLRETDLHDDVWFLNDARDGAVIAYLSYLSGRIELIESHGPPLSRLWASDVRDIDESKPTESEIAQASTSADEPETPYVRLVNRLPLPLAQLLHRAQNAREARSRHNNAYFVFEATIKLAASVLVAGYAQSLEAGEPRSEALNQVLRGLPRLSQRRGRMGGDS